MNELAQIRKLIDAADDRIIAALNERFELAKRMRAFKKAHGLPPVDAQREREIYEKVLAATDPAERDTAFGIYERILRGSRGFVETIARGVAVRDGKVLLCRAKGGQSTYLPGGHIEFGETGREALVREVKEELGTDSTAGEFLGVVENSFDQHGKRHCEITLVYRLDLASDAAESQEDWISFEWCALAELPKANLLPREMGDLLKAMVRPPVHPL